MIKKISFLLAIVLVFSILSVSCTNHNDNKTDKSFAPDKNDNTATDFDLTPDSKDIVIWIHTNDPDSPEVNDFVRKYPDYNLDNSVAVTEPFFHRNYTEEFQRLGAAIVAGNQPDLFLGYMSPIEAYYSNMFMPIHDYLTHDPEYNFETVESNVIKGGTFNDIVYFIPTAFDTQMLVWNKDLFESKGLDPERTPETWSEFLEYCQKLLSYNSEGEIQSIGCNSLDWISLHIIATGQHYTDETGLTFNIDTPSYNRALEFVKSITDIYGGNKKLPQNVDVGMHQMVTNGTQLLPIWIGNRYEFGIGKVPRPDDTEEYYMPLQWGNILAIPKSAKNPKGGWLYLKYSNTDTVLSRAIGFFEENPQLSIAIYINHIPTREKFYNEYKDLFSEKSWEMTQIRDELIRSANVPMYNLAEHTKLMLYIEEELPKVLNDEISPKEFLSNTQAYGNAILKEFKEQKIKEGWIFKDDGTAVPPESD